MSDQSLVVTVICLFVASHSTLSGIYGVGKAAEHPPALAVLSHTPDGATQTIAWVGKGIVYDTGGLSIKGKVRPSLPWRGSENFQKAALSLRKRLLIFVYEI